ncbi:DUF4087 domain-containing protein [Pseudomonas abieticivorans]|uniref:DUF4087 domain-containing protein n=1 Tax=Pseudomonas abieticivorans TaxID=2931382 RepID=UPI0020C02788|nr:DUF4087 domain-containing protein [Pseudomonas sp. PIA16]
MRLTIARDSLLLSLAIIATAQAAPTVERHCGWYQNPGNATATLSDHSGVWALPDDSAKPIFRAGQWVPSSANNAYGYGCACVSGNTDATAHSLTRIKRVNAQTLATCRADAALHEPTNRVATQ